MKRLFQRLQEPTPTFFKKVRNVGLVLTGISAVIATAPIALPLILVKIAGYVGIAGGIASALSQTAIIEDAS